MTHMNKDHPLFREVLGLGNRIVIPNLSLDGAYGLSVFEKAGFCSLVAVPITTYKVLGILGAADEKKRKFGNDIAQLLSVIASLVGVSLTKTSIMQKALPEKTGEPAEPEPRINTEIKLDITDDTLTRDEASRPVDIMAAPEKEPECRPAGGALAGRKPARRAVRDIDEKTEAFIRHTRKMGRFREHHK
jgi:hypothetical protein